MIQSLHITNVQNTPIQWWSTVEGLKNQKTFCFAPKGLTILWGKNGAGKSTLLRMLARLTHCEQGGLPKVTRESMRCFQKIGDEVLDGASVKSDGKPTYFFDPSATPGIMGGAFDEDFFKDGVSSMMFVGRMSSGQAVNANTIRIFEEAVKDGAEVDDGLLGHYQEDRHREWKKAATQAFEKSSEIEGMPTLLLDEPTRSLDIPTQLQAWSALVHLAKTKFQIIAATHDPFAVSLKGVTYVDLSDGYLEKCRKIVKAIMGKELVS